MNNWNCIRPHVDRWQNIAGVDPYDTKEFITALNKKTHKLDRLSNISASQIGKGVLYAAMMLELCCAGIYNNVRVMGHDTGIPIGAAKQHTVFTEPAVDNIAEFIDQRIEVYKDADVLFRGFKELRIEIKDATGMFRAGATCKAMAYSNRLIQPLSKEITRFLEHIKSKEFESSYWNELAYKRKNITKKALLLTKIKELEDIHLQIDSVSWGDNIHKYFTHDYTNYEFKRLRIIFDLLRRSLDINYIEPIIALCRIVDSAHTTVGALQSLATTVIDENIDELWLVKREGFVRVSNLEKIHDYIEIKSIATGRAKAAIKTIA